MIFRAFVAAALLSLASRATAEPLKLSLAAYAAATALDLHSTHRALQFEGITERNPMESWLETTPTKLVLFSAAVSTTTVYLTHRWLGKTHPKIERVILYTVAGLRVRAAVQNYGNTAGHVRR